MSIDGGIRTPYAHVVSAVVGRDLPRQFSVEAAYVGRFGRRLLVRRDVAAPANLVDTKSGTDYFTAAQALVTATQAKGIGAGADVSAYQALANIPYWENLFPAAAHDGLTATQAIAQAYNTAWTTRRALVNLDEVPASVQRLRPLRLLQPQFQSMTVQGSVGRSNYNALQLSAAQALEPRLPVRRELHAVEVRGPGFVGGARRCMVPTGHGRSLGLPRESVAAASCQWGPSDFDVRHQLNVNGVADLPFGRGKKWGGDASNLVNAIIGNWSVAGLLQADERIPVQRAGLLHVLVHQLDGQGNTELATSGALPETAVTKNGSDGYPTAFANPERGPGVLPRGPAG